MARSVLAVCKDPGGTAAIVPVVQFLRSKGVPVRLFPNGKAVELLPTMNVEFERLTSPADGFEAALDTLRDPPILLTSMCSAGGIGRDLVPLLRGRAPTIAVQDFWGGGMWTEWSDPMFRPDVLCVNDHAAKVIAKQAWPDFRQQRIVITGSPAFDRYSKLDLRATSDRVRQQLDIDGRQLVVFAGQLDRTADVLEEMVAVLAGINRPLYLAVRLHPRMHNNAPDELGRCQAILNSIGPPITLVDSTAVDMQSMIAAADLVVSMFSTALIEAAICRKPNIAVLYPGVGQAEYQKAFAGHLDDFPLVTLGCSSLARDRDQLRMAAAWALEGVLGLVANQQQHFPLDGRNAARVAEQVMKVW